MSDWPQLSALAAVRIMVVMEPQMGLPLIERARGFGDRVAIIAPNGQFSYRDLIAASERVASALLDGAADLCEARVAFLVRPGFEYAAVQWGIWRAGGIAVPLSLSHPRPELEYAITNCGAAIVVSSPELQPRVQPIGEEHRLRFLAVDKPGHFPCPSKPLPATDPSRRAMILYTSGTTSKPKGAVLTHANIQAQVTSLATAWEWSPDDHILSVLPLHHIHGIINVLTSALWSGAKCEIMPEFDAAAVWERFTRGGLTLFMAVPTVYVRLIAAWEAAANDRRRAMSEACRAMRLMVSGSAALPVSVLEKWKSISGHVLLERYGMTEIGMALSNPLRGQRLPGHVGTPLPGVEVRLVGEDGAPVPPGEAGEIQVRGPGVFLEYWGKPEATRESFLDGWFRTGDVAVVENGIYRILGRKSVDIIKTGGYKVSAIEIEEVLREHPDIAECAVVGLPDPEWGERVCAAVVLRAGRKLTLESLRKWAKERLAAYKVPSRLIAVTDLPRNAVGKVLKHELARMFEQR